MQNERWSGMVDDPSAVYIRRLLHYIREAIHRAEQSRAEQSHTAAECMYIRRAAITRLDDDDV